MLCTKFVYLQSNCAGVGNASLSSLPCDGVGPITVPAIFTPVGFGVGSTPESGGLVVIVPLSNVGNGVGGLVGAMVGVGASVGTLHNISIVV